MTDTTHYDSHEDYTGVVSATLVCWNILQPHHTYSTFMITRMVEETNSLYVHTTSITRGYLDLTIDHNDRHILGHINHEHILLTHCDSFNKKQLIKFF